MKKTTDKKCGDCKWLTGEREEGGYGYECMNPDNQERWNEARDSWMGEYRQIGRYKHPAGKACKRFERKRGRKRVRKTS